MLKTIVQNVNGRAKTTLGENAREEAVFRDGNNGARHGAREHQRLVSRAIEAGKPPGAVGHDNHAVAAIASVVAAAQNGRPFATVHEPLRDLGHERCLAGAADAQIPDADDRLTQTTPGLRVALEPAPTGPDGLRVEEVKQWV